MSGPTKKDRHKKAGGKTCEHLLCRSPRHPIADLPCGAIATKVVRPTDRQDLPGRASAMVVCGTHGNYWKRRRYTVIPLIEIKQEDQGNSK